jgi:hypothetical protein
VEGEWRKCAEMCREKTYAQRCGKLCGESGKLCGKFLCTKIYFSTGIVEK